MAAFWWFAASSVLFRVRECRSEMRLTLVLYDEIESWMDVICMHSRRTERKLCEVGKHRYEDGCPPLSRTRTWRPHR